MRSDQARNAVFAAALMGAAVAATGAHADGTVPPPGASACSGCHAPRGVDTPVPPLTGHTAADITAAMEAYRSGARSGTIMPRIAKGFTSDETAAIADWYAMQPAGPRP